MIQLTFFKNKLRTSLNANENKYFFKCNFIKNNGVRLKKYIFSMEQYTFFTQMILLKLKK